MRREDATAANDNLRTERGVAGTGVESAVPPVTDPKQRFEQDTRLIESEDLLNPPEEQELVQRSRSQG
jgi:hypothetical protein